MQLTESARNARAVLLEKHILKQLAIACHLAKLFYNSYWFRQTAFKKCGQYICEAMVDIFTDKNQYPEKHFLR